MVSKASRAIFDLGLSKAVFAPFLDIHQIGQETIDQIQPNQNYWRLRGALRSRMAHDDELKAALKKDFKEHLDDD
jgi:hypothetical protein